MLRSTFVGGIALVLLLTVVPAQAHDDTKYPDVKGQWLRLRVPGLVGQPSYDPKAARSRPR